MKKYIARVLVAILVLNLCPAMGTDIFGGFEIANAESARPPIFYIAENFDSQETGEKPNGFYHNVSSGGSFVEKVEKDGNSDNQAIKVQATTTNVRKITTFPFYYAPIHEKFVLEFKLKRGTSNASGYVTAAYDIENIALGNSLEGETGSANWMVVGSTLKVNGTTVKSSMGTDWHDIKIEFDLRTDKANITVDGTVTQNVSMPAMDNICSIGFTSAQDTSSWWAIDDFKLYIADGVLSSSEFDAEYAKYKASGLTPPARYVSGFMHQYNNYMYEALYNEFVICKYGKRFYKDNKFHTLPVNVFEKDGDIFVPVRAFCEEFGAEVGYDNGKITVSYNGKTLEVTEGQDIYYIDGKPAKLYNPIEMKGDYAVINLKILTKFFGLTATELDFDLISFTGDVESSYSMPEGIDRTNRHTYMDKEYDLTTEVLHRTKQHLQAENPTPEKLIEIYNQRNTPGESKKLMTGWNSFDDLKAAYNNGNCTDATLKKIFSYIISKADDYVKKNSNGEYTALVSSPVGGDSVWFWSRLVAFAWNITEDTKYLDAIKAQIDLWDEKLPEWNAKSEYARLTHTPLTMGGATHGLATLYDWARADLGSEYSAKLLEILKDVGYFYFDGVYKTPNRATSVYTYNIGNQSIIINSAVIALASALWDDDPQACAELLSVAIPTLVQPLEGFFPSGKWDEGASYWEFTMNWMTSAFLNLDSVFGTSFGLYDMPGVSNTAEYPISVLSTKGTTYPFGDADSRTVPNIWFMYQGRKNNDEGLINFEKGILTKSSTQPEEAFSYPIGQTIDASSGIHHDITLEGGDTVILKDGLTASDTSIVLHAGNTTDNHGHADNGDFQFDMLGYRWAGAVGREDYDLTSFGTYEGRDVNTTAPYTGYTGTGDYYRNRAEGHSTVIAALGETRRDMEPSAESEIIETYFSDDISFAKIDMTETNSLYDYAIRGIKLDKANNVVMVQDDFKASSNTDFWWFMQTQANVELATDKKSAILTSPDGTKRIWAGIISSANNETFEVLESKPIELAGILKHEDIVASSVNASSGTNDGTKTSYTITSGETGKLMPECISVKIGDKYYNVPTVSRSTASMPARFTFNESTGVLTIQNSILGENTPEFAALPMRPTDAQYENVTIRPPLETPVGEAFRKLTIHSENTQNFKVCVAFVPLASGQNAPAEIPVATALEAWRGTGEDVVMLSGVQLDGIAFAEFDPDVKNYKISTQDSIVPTITATANEGYRAEVIPATTVPGVTTIVVRKGKTIAGFYFFEFEE